MISPYFSKVLSVHPPICPRFYICPLHPPLLTDAKGWQLTSLYHLVKGVLSNRQQLHHLSGRQVVVEFYRAVIVLAFIAERIIAVIVSCHGKNLLNEIRRQPYLLVVLFVPFSVISYLSNVYY